jgi:putative transposase
MADSDLSGVLELYAEAVPKQFFEQLARDLGLPVRQQVFDLPLVTWLMISQRLDRKATLSTAVQQVVQRQPQALLSKHKRILDGTVSCHTGAYSDARQAMPVVVAETVADRMLDHLMQSRRDALPGWNRRVFILDGSSLEMPHTAELVEAYPPHPKSHWPVLLMLVAQDLTTALAERPLLGRCMVRRR